MSNFYDVLGVSETASQEDIKKAYRKLSLQYHPDRNNNSPESTAKFQSISAAYDIIGDEDKRRQHDMQSKMQFGPGGMGMPFANMGQHMGGMHMGGMHGGNMHSGNMHSGNMHSGNMHMGGMPTFFTTSTSGDFDPSDLLNFVSNNFFGGGGGGGGGGIKIDGNGIRVGNTLFNMDTMKQRMAKPTPIIKTETITLSKAYTGYNMPIEITRWIVEGDVKREETETIYIPIPRGVDNNELIILRDKGNSLSEHNKGDIKVFIKIQNESEFTRNGLDLILNKTISLKDALCGFIFDMNFLDGRIFKLNNNVGSIIANNYNKVIPGLGMKRDDHTGNLLINFTVTFPEQLSLEQIEALQKIL
jgi:DnaJ family protein B protein 4